RWYTSTSNLRIVCLDLCVACRAYWNVSTWNVVVTADTPNGLWVRGERDARPKEECGALRVPPLPVGGVTLAGYPAAVLARLSEGVRLGGRTRECLAMGRRGWLMRLFRQGPLWWPDTLRQLTFGNDFDKPIESFPWPACLQQLSFRPTFNQRIDRVVWLASLQKLSFGERFNQPIVNVLWPASLQQLSFGMHFNQPI
ncbi:unnamed protein product, partial [Pylaiella littoralis]